MSEENPDLEEAIKGAAAKSLNGYRKGSERIAPDEIVIRVTIDAPIDRFVFVVCVVVTISPLAIMHLAGVNLQNHIPAIIGLALAAVAVGLAFAKSAHSPLQRQVILALFALAGGAIATEIPGFLNVNVSLGEKTVIAAGGALAVFIVLYLISARKPPD